MKKLFGLGFALCLCILAFGTRPAEANEVVGPFSTRKACEAAAAASNTEHSSCYRCGSGQGYCYTSYPPGCPATQGSSYLDCEQIIVYAKDPETGACCQFPDPCSVPEGWTVYYYPPCIEI